MKRNLFLIIFIEIIICLMIIIYLNNNLYKSENINIDNNNQNEPIYMFGGINLDSKTGFKIENGYLIGIEFERTVSDFDLGLDLSYNVTILDKDNKIKTDENIFNGDKIRINQNNNTIGEYVILIDGDVSGDGKLSPLDYVKIKNHIMENNYIVGDVYLKAADYNNDNSINPLDYVKIKNNIINRSSNKYTITYNANGGYGSIGSQIVTKDTTTNVRRNTFKREGYTFGGWNTSQDGKGTSYSELSKIRVSGNITLYAMWNDNPNNKKVNYNNFKWFYYKKTTGPVANYYSNTTAYAVWAPENVSDLNGVSLPLIVWLHGTGERLVDGCGESCFIKHGLPGVIGEWSKYNLDPIPAIIVSPQSYDEWKSTTNYETIKALIEYAKDTYNVDTSNVVLMGHSMGGNGVIYIAYELKNTFSKLVLMSASKSSYGDKEYFANIPMKGYGETKYKGSFLNWCGHGDDFVLYSDTSHGNIPEKALTEDTNGDGISDLMYWLFYEQ